jgi:hypothetical protein
MTIDQRNAGASVTPTASNTFLVDRWSTNLTQSSKFSAQQNAGSVTPPTGFSNYLGVTSLSSYSVLTGDLFALLQTIEGFNTSDLAWGTASAATVTLSFWVRSSLTGTFGGSLANNAYAYSYPFTYTISSANTWEQKSVTIAGPTAGTWIGATNGIGIRVYFGLGSGTTNSGTAGAWSANGYISATGAVSVVGTSGATFYITGVQLEVGSQATSFDFRSIGQELLLCQRYYEKSYDQATKPATAISYGGIVFLALGYLGVNCNTGCSFCYRVTKRTNPTVTIYSPQTGAAGYARVGSGGDIAANVFGNGDTGTGCYVAGIAGGVDYSIQYTASAEL